MTADWSKHLKKMSHPSRVAFACCVAEHVLSVYRLGKVQYRVSDVPGLGKLDGDADLFEFVIGLGWTFAERQKKDAATGKAVRRYLDKQLGVLESLAEKNDALAEPAVGALGAAYHALLAIDDPRVDEPDFAAGNAEAAVFYVVRLMTDDEDVPTEEGDRESAWQSRVSKRLLEQGDKAISREDLRDLLQEELPWCRYLKGYAERCGAAADVATEAVSVKKTAKKKAAKKKAAKKKAAKKKAAKKK